ncbi:hypothetical protein CK203_066178 [Vitis vinifera]|uniref:Uncharacterized protein n=1 Tax=Vitis vinifera TaxID=29760 RepID=A0A438G6F8_VITVI|nr:hypothetical protein CK203_066178 [Vitis vinifera]
MLAASMCIESVYGSKNPFAALTASMKICKDFKNLQSLEICGGGLTDAGVKNIKDLTCLTVLNLSQNCNLTDKSLELISGEDFCKDKCDIIWSILTYVHGNGFTESNSRVDCAGLFECFQLSYNQCRVAASEATEEFEVTDTGFVQDILSSSWSAWSSSVYKKNKTETLNKLYIWVDLNAGFSMLRIQDTLKENGNVDELPWHGFTCAAADPLSFAL